MLGTVPARPTQGLPSWDAQARKGTGNPLQVPRKGPGGRTVRAMGEKDSVRQIQSANMAPGRWNSVCKGPAGSRWLCSQDFKAFLSQGQSSRQRGPDMGCSKCGRTRGSRVSRRGVKTWLQSERGNG